MREGERPREVTTSYWSHRCTIYGWLKAAHGCDKKFQALAARAATGRPCALTVAQGRQVFRWLNGKNPMPYDFDFGRWPRQIVHKLIVQQFDVHLCLASIGTMLARRGLMLQRAYQRDPEAIERWQRAMYSAIAQTAKREKPDLHFCDASGFRANALHGTTWVPRDRRRWCRSPARVGVISAAPAVSSKGAFWVATYPADLNGGMFVTLLRGMVHGHRRPLHLILDGLPAHKTNAVKQYVAGLNEHLILHYLHGYAPDLNPDESVWSHAKRTGNARRPLQKGEKLDARVTRQ